MSSPENSAGPEAAKTVSCPSCGAALAQPVDHCDSCGLRLSGPEAQELWHVDQRLAALQQRRTELLSLLREPVTATATAEPPLAPAQPVPTPAQPAPPPRWAAQQVLLAVGALLVLVAAVVFLAVAWSAVGVAGQVAVMALLTLAAGAGSILLARRGLRASREAMAVLAVALAVLDGAAAHRLNLAGLRSVNELGYAAVATAALALVLVAVTPPVLRRSAASYRLFAVLAAAAAPLLALAAADAGPLAATVTCAVMAGLAGWGSRRLPGGCAPYRPWLTVVFGGYLVLTWSFGLFAVLDQPLLGAGGLAAAAALVASVGAGRAAHLHQGLRAAQQDHPLLAASALLAGAGLVVNLAWQGGVGWLAVLTVLAGMVPVLVCFLSGEPDAGLWGVTAASGQLVAVLAVVALTLLAPIDEEPGFTAACAATLAGACCSAAILAVLRPRWREPATAWSAATGAAAVGTATAAIAAAGSTAVGYALTAVVVVLLIAAARVRVRLEIILLAVAAGTGLIACVLAALAPSLAVGAVGTLPPLALVLTALGLTALAYGIRPTRDLVAWVGVLLCSAGNAVRLAEAEVTVVEAYSLPLAGLALVVGLIRLRRQPNAPSWLTVGPAVSTGLLPSAFATIGDPALTRPMLVVGVAAVVMVLGVRWRWQAPFLTGALAACIVAVTQVAPYAVGAPRWLSFGTVGIVLLVLGFRYEQRRQNASQAVHWVAALR